MKSKLTLNIDREISDRAKAYARSQGRSLSDLVENILMALTTDLPNQKLKPTPITDFLAGSIDLDGDIDYREEYRNFIISKYSTDEESVS